MIRKQQLYFCKNGKLIQKAIIKGRKTLFLKNFQPNGDAKHTSNLFRRNEWPI